jgi:hypothetical protein
MAHMGDRRVAYRVLVGKPGKPRRRWKNNIKIDFQEAEFRRLGLK